MTRALSTATLKRLRKPLPPSESTASVRIGIVDSGVGGLSLLPSLTKALPAANITYCCDDSAFPYGTLSQDQILERITLLSEHLARKAPFDLLIVACNTASTVGLQALRERFHQPVVGVVPAIKPAAAMSKTGVIGLLATSATVGSPYTAALIQDFAKDCRVLKVGSPGLVGLAEEKLRGRTPSQEAIDAEIKALTTETDLDTVVLGCTHFSHLIEELTHGFSGRVTLVDSNEAITRRVRDLVASLPISRFKQEPTRVFHTAEGPSLPPVQRKLWQERFNVATFHHLPIH